MLLGRSQLLLAGIPTGAALIGLLWLKRRRSNQSLHHTDPGGSKQEEEINKEIEEETINPEESIISYKRVEKTTLAKSNILEDLTIGKSAEDSLPDLRISEDTAESSVDFNEEEESKISIEDSTAFPLIFDIEIKENEETIDSKQEINILKEKESLETIEVAAKVNKQVHLWSEDKVSEVQIHKISETEAIDSVTITDTITENIVHLQESVKTDLKIEEQPREQLVSSSTEATEKENTEQEEVEKNQEEEEGAKANMKTSSTQLAEKLASLELDTMKIRDENVDSEQKVCTERDSANHSPSEVMLASPSISNFSDAHSEGSSDSGKGHSDVATSPSRTPAGGSSLAGDLAPSIYEFVLPQIIVGRLIGRRGTFLHEIRSSTQTNIYIKRHPDTNKLKICAIEGSQQDIEKALAKIRQKFPLRRFPQLTLEKVSFVTLNTLPPLKLEDFHLQLVENVNNDVILSSLITAAHFFLQQPSHPSYSSLGTLNQVMNQVYSTSEAPTLETPIKDAVCAAPTMGGWYRAQIVSLDEEAGNSTVRFLDYGGYLTMESSNLRQIRADLLALPFQAVECYLANVAPADEAGWTEEARLFVHNLTVGQVLQAQIYDYAEDGTPLVYLYASYGSQVVLINEELVMRGYGVMTSIQEE
uniref:Putative a-kinase anchor protein 1 mitochondrial-like isoform x1 n=1 Tax=Panstrongylus lignarius TaxID=156445 RepID=A0A224XLB2_9HEMI